MANFNIDVNASIDPTAKSTGGNEAADAGKLLEFNTGGQIQGSAVSSSLAAVKGTASGTAYGVHGESVGGTGVVAGSTNGNGLEASSINAHAISAINFDGTDEPLHVKNANVANTADLATFRRNNNQGLNIKNDGGLEWTSATGAGTTRTNLGLGTLATQDGTFSGTSSGTNTGDQTITLTGDVTGSGTGSFAATIANQAVTFAKMQHISTAHLLGRHSAGTGDVQQIGIDGGLELQGSNIRRAALTGDVTASAGDNATTIANDAVTNAKMANMAQATIKGRAAAAGTGDPQDLTASEARTAMGLGTAAVVNTGTGSGDVPTTADADARYLQGSGPHAAYVPPAGQYVIPSVSALALGTTAGATDRMDIFPFIPSKTFSIDTLGLEVTTLVAASNFKLAIYADNAGLPGSLIVGTGNLSGASLGVRTEAIASTQLVAGTTYWLAVHSSAAITFRGIAVGGCMPIAYPAAGGTTLSTIRRATGQTFGSGLPDPCPAGTLTGATIQAVMLRVA